MKPVVVALLVVVVAVGVFADDKKPCLLACEPNNDPICARDTKTNKTETLYNYCAMLHKNQCEDGSYEQVQKGACPEDKDKTTPH